MKISTIILFIGLFCLISLSLIAGLFRIVNPTTSTLNNANLLGFVVHGALAVLMFLLKKPLKPGIRVDFKETINDKEEVVYRSGKIVSVDKENNTVTLVTGIAQNTEKTIPSTAIIDSWIMTISNRVVQTGVITNEQYNKLINDTFKGDSPVNATKVIVDAIYKTFDGRIEVTELIDLSDSCAIFSFITSCAHLSLYVFKNFYLTQVNQRQNNIRWLEYTISSGIMMVNIASIVGIQNNYNLLTILLCTAITNIFGMAIEQTTKVSYKWAFMFFGFIPFGLPWIKIINTLLYNSDFVNEVFEIIGNDTEYIINARKNVTYATYGVLVIAFCYLSFPAIQICQILYPEKYRTGEFLFILASLVAKVALNLFVYIVSRNLTNVFQL